MILLGRMTHEKFRLSTPLYENAVRFVCISDTHERLSDIVKRIPAGDVLIHAGDFTNFGDRDEIIKFNETIGSSALYLNKV